LHLRFYFAYRLSKGLPAGGPLDEFADATEASWKEAIEAIEGLMED
jgi:hypothetical protein